MDTICMDDIRSLMQKTGGAHVSIFMPTHRKGGEDPQDPIRFRNLLRKAEDKLVANNLRTAEARTLLAPADKLLTDNLFWRQQANGLALFIEANKIVYYRLPIDPQEEVGVGNRYYIKPLVSLVSDCGWFYVLSLSRHENRLLQCTSGSSLRIDLGDVPKNMPDALFYITPENRMQYHIESEVGGANFGATSAIQAGEGSRPNYDKRNVLQYFEQVNKGVAKLLQEEKAPLVLSAVDYLHPIYQSANTYHNLLPKGIIGNPDEITDDVLREQAWAIVEPHFNVLKKKAVEEFNKSASKGRAAIGPAEVLPAASSGRVRFLFVAEGAQKWGTFDPATNVVKEHTSPQSTDDDLVDLAVYLTLNQAGSVFVFKADEVPGGKVLSAIRRF